MLIAFVLFALIAVPSNLYVKSFLPQTKGTLSLPMLHSTVQVYRDKFGIPHIYAKNEDDAQVALGFVMAQDRLFQMDINRRIASGRLSEYFGEKTVEIDVLLRKLRIKKTMDEYWQKNAQKLDPAMLSSMQNFLAGVHYYIDHRKLPIEYKLLGVKPEKFTPQDMMAISGYIALSFAEALIADPLYSDLYAKLPASLVEQLNRKERMRSLQEGKDFITEQPWFKRTIGALELLEQNFGLFHGSNAWVMSAQRSKSGKPLLASDPHIAFSSPGVWYEAHVKTPNYESYGHYIPLVPFPLLNHNRFGGYGVTISEQDDFDLYAETINPKNHHQVKFRGKWVKLREYQEVIKVKKAKDRVITVKVTPHGPLIDDTKYGVKGKHVALKWSYYHSENNVGLAFFKMSHAKNMQEFFQAVSYAAAPGLNVLWADRSGNIGWHVMGKIPLRPKGRNGFHLLDGASGNDEYVGYLPFKENPHLENPKSGVIVSANYKPQQGSFNPKRPLLGYWQPQDRFLRIHKLLAQKRKWSLEELKQVQVDRVDDRALESLPIMLKAISSIDYPLANEAKKYLQNWNREADANSIGAMIYYQWIPFLMSATLEDQMGHDSYKAYERLSDYWYAFYDLLKNSNSQWWDDVNTKVHETQQDILQRSFRETLTYLKEHLGSSVTDWQWGRLHSVEYQHFFGRKKPLNYFFNVGPFPASGGFSMVDNMGHSRGSGNFKVTRGPSTRRLIDFADPLNSLGILPTGNSGLPYSPHYDDQAQMFLRGEYRGQIMDPRTIKHLQERLELTP